MRSAFWLALPLALSSAACTYDNGDARRVTDPNGNLQTKCDPQKQQGVIEVDGKLELTPGGEGAGVFVEYATGGHWSVTTSCDTNKSNLPCQWDLYITAEDGTKITNARPVDLEAGDGVGPVDRDPQSILFVTSTSDDYDGITFDMPPGRAVLFDTLLDGSCTNALPLIFWLDDGAVHEGTPGNPFALVPSGD